MANDRLYIRCNECGELLFVGKHFGGSWDVRNQVINVLGISCELEIPFGAVLEKFLEKHLYNDCCNRTNYSFVAEFDDDFPDKPQFFTVR